MKNNIIDILFLIGVIVFGFVAFLEVTNANLVTMIVLISIIGIIYFNLKSDDFIN